MGGMRDYSAGDMPGDVFDDRESQDRSRATVVRVTSPSRHSQDRARASQDTGRSTSVADRPSRQFGRLQRTNTDGTQARERSSHKNRFFGRSRHRDEETGMVDIPESGYDSSESKGKLDPRSGLVSPRAMRMSTDESRHPQSSGALPNTADTDRTFSAPHRAQTDTLEMRRLH